MRNLLVLAVLFVCMQPAAKAQATVIPAGTLLHCTTDDPSLSPKTVEVGDPVLCHLSQTMEFGRPAFPRGSYLAGHVEAAKQPGHFVGKGYLAISFDRIGLPTADSEISTKIVAAQGQHIDNQGRVIGHGHAKRDAIEWMIPPLWPWKVITLPARGPQPKLKNEQMITLKLMQDVELPQLTAYSPSPAPWRHFGDADAPAVPTYQTLFLAPTRPFVLIALKSETIYPAKDYWISGNLLVCLLPDGRQVATNVKDIDWQRTSDLNVERGVRVILRTMPGQSSD